MTAPGQQRLPGVGYRTETHQRLVPHTIDGKTNLVEEDYNVDVPVPPRDWDRIVSAAVLAGAGALVAIAIVWSVASIGDLLTTGVPEVIAYLAAGAFVGSWVICMAMEWLARYDHARASGPRVAGSWALAADMAAIALHGHRTDALYVGLVGAGVSALAKAMWTVAMRYQARPLPERDRKWLLAEEGDINARLALAARRRTLARAEGQAAVYTALTNKPAELPPAPAPAPDMPGHHQRTVLSAVRAAAVALPDATPEDIVEQLDTLGITTDTDTVRTVLTPDTDTKDSRSEPPVRPIAPAGHSISDSVRTALASGITAPSAVLDYVRGLHGQDVKADTVARVRRRVDPKEIAS